MGKYRLLADIQRDLLAKKITVSDLVADYLATIAKNQHLNAFLEVYTAEIIQQAKDLDEKIASGKPLGRLFGCVIGVKDNICYKGHKVSAGSKILGGYTSLFSATAIERLLTEDALIIGRLNCDEFAMGSSNENSAYGSVLNALDNSRVPGGSSGGSAVAVQADMCLVALGSDTGGSIRQPAAFCGVVGLKPTYGRISRYGLIAYASSFDQIGPLAHSVEDCAITTSVMAGADDYDSTASQRNVGDWSKLSYDKKANIAILKHTIDHPGLSEDVKNATNLLIEKLKNAGHTIDIVDFDLIDYLIPTYYVLTTAEASSNLARFDGVRYGYRSPNAKDMESVYKLSRSEGFGKEVKNRIMLGTFVLSAGYYDAYYAKAQKVRNKLKQGIDKILTAYDFILMPTTPSVAFKIGEKTSDPVEMYLADIYTVLANLVGVPAISLPIGKGEADMPIGIQLMAARFEEEKLLAFSAEIEKI